MQRYIKGGLPFGLAGGVLSIVFFMVIYFLDRNPIQNLLLYGLVVTPIFLFLGIKNFRDHQNEGILFFGQGMTVGFVIYMLMALISGFFVLLYVGLIDQELLQDYTLSKLSYLEEQKTTLVNQIGEESYDTLVASNSAISVSDIALDDIFKKIIAGLFYTIIISIILRVTKN